MPADEIAATDDFPRDQSSAGEIDATTVNPDTTPEPADWKRSPWFWLVSLLVLGLVIRYMPVPNQAVATIGTLVALALHVVCVVNFAALATRWQLSAPRWTVLLILCLLLFGASLAIRPFLVTMLAAQGREPDPFAFWTLVGSLNYTIRPLLLLGAAVCAGSLVAKLINARNMVGPVCAIIALIDVWGVLLGGLVTQLLERGPEAAKTVGLSDLPVVGQATGAVERFVIPQLQIGVGDYLFLGLLFAALHRNQMDWRAAMRWTVPLIIIALFGVAYTGIHMPGLLFIGLGVAVPNWRYFEYTREEKFALLYSGLFVVVLTAGLYFGITSMLPEKPPGQTPSDTASTGRQTTPGAAPAGTATTPGAGPTAAPTPTR